MSRPRVEDIRNVAFVGHGAVGKTTLADQMLFKAGCNSRPGSVEDGSSMLDFDEEAKQHKYTVTASLCHFTHHGKYFNVLNTPGYPDFIGGVVGALRAVENAVIVINAAAGIEVNTRKVFQMAGEAGLGRIIVINKLDHENVKFPELIDSIHATFGACCVLMNVPDGVGPNFTKVISTLNPSADRPDNLPLDPADVSQHLMDAIVESDEALMTRYLDGEVIQGEELEHAVEHAIAEGTLIPIFCTCSKTGIGVPELMDAIADEGLHPLDLHRKALAAAPANGHGSGNGSSNGNAQEEELVQKEDWPLVAQVFKTRIDPFVSKMSFVRVFSGKVAKDATVTNVRTGKLLKIGSLFHLQGNHQEPTDAAGPGELVVLVKMDDLQVGDTIVADAKHVVKLPPIKFPAAMSSLGVEPKTQADQQKISSALHKIEEEDQTFHATREAQTHELIIHGLSELHLKIIEERLSKREKVQVIAHAPKIPYRETVASKAEGMYRHKKQTGGAGQFGEVHMRIFPVPRDVPIEEFCTSSRFEYMREYHHHPELNFVFIDSISGGSIPNQYIPAVEKGVLERLTQGVIAGYPVQDVGVELHFGKYHAVDSNENAFKTAGRMCLKQIFAQAKPALLEPIVKVEITIPGEKFGDITSDLNSRRGRVEGMDSALGGFQTITAKLPLSEVSTYARSLSSMTGGQGSFTMEFSHYDLMPPNEQAKVIAAAGKMKEDEE